MTLNLFNLVPHFEIHSLKVLNGEKSVSINGTHFQCDSIHMSQEIEQLNR